MDPLRIEQDFIELSGDGKLNSGDFVSGYKRLDEDSVFNAFDLDNDGYLSFVEARIFMEEDNINSKDFYDEDGHYQIESEDAVQAFINVDSDSSGDISSEEVEQFLAERRENAREQAFELVTKWATAENRPEYIEAINIMKDRFQLEESSSPSDPIALYAMYTEFLHGIDGAGAKLFYGDDFKHIRFYNAEETASTLVHELSHAIGHNFDYDEGHDCYGEEVNAFTNEALYREWAGLSDEHNFVSRNFRQSSTLEDFEIWLEETLRSSSYCE